jgi:hypothetical protein
MKSPSSAMRVSTTWVSAFPQKGHFMAAARAYP